VFAGRTSLPLRVAKAATTSGRRAGGAPARRSCEAACATAGPLDRVKQCPPGCAFLFFDASKNRIRRWCSMDECGGQEKAKRQTARRRSARAR
jgi:predicted RNA-binding Zn ribbon-like protein